MISQRAQKINPSPTLLITVKAKEMKANGIDVVSFGAGEPDFDTPENIKQAAIKAIKEGFTKYTATSGIPELKKAICDKFKRDNGLTYEPSNILVSTGAKQCLYNVIQVLVNPGDEVIIPVPYWVSYEEMVELAAGKCVFVKTNQFKITGDMLARLITRKTRALILNSPSNPTGVVYDKQELETIAWVCIKNHVYIISDEIYESLIYEKKHVSIGSLNDQVKKLTVVVNGVSKAYSMTGWRIGYCAAETDIIKAASALQDHSTSNPNSVAQKAALAALTGPQSTVVAMRNAYRQRRDYMLKRLQSTPGITVEKPDGAFYVFAGVSSLYNKQVPDSMTFSRTLLEKKHVAVIPGKAFGDDQYIRLSYATSDDNIKKGLNRLADYVNSLRSSK